MEILGKIIQVLKDDLPKSFNDCVSWARKLFEELFHNSVAQLLHNFPPDQQTSTGKYNDIFLFFFKLYF